MSMHRDLRKWTNTYQKEQLAHIQSQINKTRNLVEDRQSRLAEQTINEVSRRKNTLRAKLKAASQEERQQKWEEHVKNLLRNPPEKIKNKKRCRP